MITHQADLVVVHGRVITMDSTRRILSNGGIAVHDGRIVEVSGSREIEQKYSAAKKIDAGGGVVQPGFVDCHVHMSQHLGRSTIPDSWPDEREHDQWLPYWLNMTENDAYCSALLACMETVRNGTTTFCDSGARFQGEINASAADAVGMRGLVAEVCWDKPPHPEVGVGDTSQCLSRLERLIQALPRTSGSRICAAVGIAGMGMCSDELVAGAKKLADQSGLIFDMHLSYIPRKQSGDSPIPPVEHLDELGVLGPNLQLIHMIHTTVSELGLLARTGTNVVHCPAASTRMGMGAFRVGHFPEMHSEGINLALGSDSGNYSDSFDIGRQAYLAASIHKEVRGKVPVFSSEDVLEMATINGARSLGMEDQIGSLESGKKAHIVVHTNRRPEWHPCLDVTTSLVYNAQTSGVDTVIIDGNIVLEGGVFSGIDEQKEYQRIDEAAQDLYRRMGFQISNRWPVE